MFTLTADRECAAAPGGRRPRRDRWGRRVTYRAAMIAAWLAIAACHEEHWLTYPWDDRQILCSQPFDDMEGQAPWGMIERQIELAESTSSVLLLHAHTVGVSVS